MYENTKVIINNTIYNGTTTYECEHDYYLVQGNLQRTCLMGTRWSGLPPVCERKSLILIRNTVNNDKAYLVHKYIYTVYSVFGFIVVWSNRFMIGKWFLMGVFNNAT